VNSFLAAQKFGLAGTDQKIVTQLIASGVTASPIDLAYLMETLNFRGMLRKTDGAGGTERWIGTLPNLKAALIALSQTEAVVGYETWFSHVTNPRQAKWATNQPEYAAPFWALRNAFADQPTMPTSADFAAVAALGGGWLFAELTVEQFAADKTAYEQQQQDAEAERLAEEQSQLNQSRKSQMYSALLDASRWVELQDQCPTVSELLARLTPNLPSEE
jgi:hypothetical protein